MNTLLIDFVNPSGLVLESKPHRIINKGNFWEVRSYYKVEDEDEDDEDGKRVWVVDTDTLITKNAINGIDLTYDNSNGLYSIDLIATGMYGITFYFTNRVEANDVLKILKKWRISTP